MFRAEHVAGILKGIGGIFRTDIEELQQKVSTLNGFVFDWDGVFNMMKGGPTFSEPDSMGLNMLRYGFWRENREMPFMAIISSDKPSIAHIYAKRDHFNAVYCGFHDKVSALDHLCTSAQPTIMPWKDLAFFFDDINDISTVKRCGVKIQIRRDASPLLSVYVIQNELCDYVTGSTANENGLREASEMLLGLKGIYFETVKSRVNFDEDYQTYLEELKRIETSVYTLEEGSRIICRQ